MPTPPKPCIGTVVCPFTGKRVAVKKDKNGKFFIVSTVGHLFLTTTIGQEWILEHADMHGDDPDHAPPDLPHENDLPAPPQNRKAKPPPADPLPSPPAAPGEPSSAEPDDAPEPIDPPAPKRERKPSLLDDIL